VGILAGKKEFLHFTGFNRYKMAKSGKIANHGFFPLIYVISVKLFILYPASLHYQCMNKGIFYNQWNRNCSFNQVPSPDQLDFVIARFKVSLKCARH